MRTLGATMLVLACAGLAACSGGNQAEPPPSTKTVVAPPSSAPPEPKPARTATCPYLDKSTISEMNGQHVAKVRISTDSRKTPTCFFYRPDGSVQLTVRPYRGDSGAAHALVDAAVPVRTSAKATDPPGWSGGSQPTDSGAVYAVAKRDAAVVVKTNQRQTIKARQVAERTIEQLAGNRGS